MPSFLWGNPKGCVCYYHIFISISINIIPGFPVTAILNTSVTVQFPNWIHNFTDHIILMFSISLPIYYHFHLQFPYLPQLIFTVVSGLHFSSSVHISDCHSWDDLASLTWFPNQCVPSLRKVISTLSMHAPTHEASPDRLLISLVSLIKTNPGLDMKLTDPD